MHSTAKEESLWYLTESKRSRRTQGKDLSKFGVLIKHLVSGLKLQIDFTFIVLGLLGKFGFSENKCNIFPIGAVILIYKKNPAYGRQRIS